MQYSMIKYGKVSDFPEEITLFLRDCKAVPYREFGIPLDQHLIGYFIREHSDDQVLLACCNNQITGLLIFSRIEWDSRFFHHEMSRIDLFSFHRASAASGEQLLNAFFEKAREQGLEHVSIRMDMAEIEVIHVLERNGFFIVDTLQTSVCQGGAVFPYRGIREYTEDDMESLLSLGRSAFTHSRFAADRQLDGKDIIAMYEAWVRQCCLCIRVEKVFVSEDSKQISGFIACGVNQKIKESTGSSVGFIDLIAVSSEFRGKQWGLKLVSCAQDWFAKNCDIYTVGTRCDNFAALRMYLKVGFRICSSKIGMHKWL